MAKKAQSEVTEEIEGNVIEGTEHVPDWEEKMTQCEQEIEVYKNQYLRALADYKNLEHRVQNERQQMRDNIKREFVEKLLPVLDNLDQAEVFMDDPGLKMVSSSFRKSLAELGVQEVDLLGSEFDPQYAEVIEVVPGKQENVIVEVLQRAYELNGHLIRHGKVKVSKSEMKN